MIPLKKVTKRRRPEAIIQRSIIQMLRGKGWHVEVMHGNSAQFGIPDLYATHVDYKSRWIEVKNPLSYSFTPAQLRKFPLFVANGSPVWILVAATEDEYKKLFRDCNWWTYLKT